MSEKIVDLSKAATRYLFTLIFAAIGAYMGVDRYLHSLEDGLEKCQEDIATVDYDNGINSQSLYEVQINQVNIVNELTNITSGEFEVPYLQYTKPRGGNLAVNQ